MDVGGGDGRMARSDHHLMQIRDHVTNGIDAVYSYSLMHVRIQATSLCRARRVQGPVPRRRQCDIAERWT